MNLTQGEPAKYEQVIGVDDFVRLMKEENDIKTSLVEIFPGLQVAFVIRKLATFIDQWRREIPDSDIVFYNGLDCGKVEDIEMKSYQEFNPKLIFSSRNSIHNKYSGGNKVATGMFLYNPTALPVTLKFELYNQPWLRSRQDGGDAPVSEERDYSLFSHEGHHEGCLHR